MEPPSLGKHISASHHVPDSLTLHCLSLSNGPGAAAALVIQQAGSKIKQTRKGENGFSSISIQSIPPVAFKANRSEAKPSRDGRSVFSLILTAWGGMVGRFGTPFAGTVGIQARKSSPILFGAIVVFQMNSVYRLHPVLGPKVLTRGRLQVSHPGKPSPYGG